MSTAHSLQVAAPAPDEEPPLSEAEKRLRASWAALWRMVVGSTWFNHVGA